VGEATISTKGLQPKRGAEKPSKKKQMGPYPSQEGLKSGIAGEREAPPATKDVSCREGSGNFERLTKRSNNHTVGGRKVVVSSDQVDDENPGAGVTSADADLNDSQQAVQEIPLTLVRPILI